MGSSVAENLTQLNGGLRSTGVRLRLEQRGERLGLRGPLPRRDGRPGLQVQRLSLGLPADAAGLKEALRQLYRLQAELDQGRFVWPGPTAAEAPGLAAVLERFEAAFFAEPRRRRFPAGSRSTWTAAYLPYLRRLQSLAEGPLGPELLERVLESYPLASRSRQQCGTVLAVLARQEAIALPGDWAERAGGYGLHQAQFRQLPSDRAILEAADLIPNPGWRLAFGLMATYGLRNHEVFFTDLGGLDSDPDAVLRVLPPPKPVNTRFGPFNPSGWTCLTCGPWASNGSCYHRFAPTWAAPPCNRWAAGWQNNSADTKCLSPPMTCATPGPCAPFTWVCPIRWRLG